MRGKGHLTLAVSHMHRINPAYAGKRGPFCRLPEGSEDYPRVCGEKLYIMFMAAQKSGSPPHMRGKVDVGDGVDALAGITPAYAGKRPPRAANAAFRWDHPRVRGEKTKKIP